MKRLVARLLTVYPPVRIFDTKDRIKIEADFSAISNCEVIITEQGRKIAIVDCKVFEEIGISTDGSLPKAKTLLLKSLHTKLNNLSQQSNLASQLDRLGFTFENTKSSIFEKEVELFDLALSNENQTDSQ